MSKRITVALVLDIEDDEDPTNVEELLCYTMGGGGPYETAEDFIDPRWVEFVSADVQEWVTASSQEHGDIVTSRHQGYPWD